MKSIKRLRILGLFGDRDVNIPVNGHAMVIVGPNGIGKSTVANIFYYFATRQWDRLKEIEFNEVLIETDEEIVSVKYEDLIGGHSISDLFGTRSAGSRVSRMAQYLSDAGEFNRFVSFPSINVEQYSHYAKLMKIRMEEVPRFHKYLKNQIRDSGIESEGLTLANDAVSRVVESRVMYLPTYRRIERDIDVVFPDFESRYRKYGHDREIEAGRYASHYVELVSFGMDDVEKNLGTTLSGLREHSLNQFNNLSASYLRDVIRGEGEKFAAKDIKALDESDIVRILDRVNEEYLPLGDKLTLRKKIREIQGKRKRDVGVSERYLAHYFSKLVTVTDDLEDREGNLRDFVEVCNRYLAPRKSIKYDELTYSVKVLDGETKEIDLAHLSSGEKQIVSLFSHLYLDENLTHSVFIDEPELSLSVPWQKMFLMDIVDSEHCDFLLAVTHSPFVFDNDLRDRAFDLREFVDFH